MSGEYVLDLGQGFDTIALPDLDFRTLFGSVLPDLGVDEIGCSNYDRENKHCVIW